MVPVARKMLWKEKTRFLITVSGVGLSAMLMLFLLGVYQGVKKGSTSYIANSAAEIWICQRNSTNLLRSSSFLRSSMLNEIKQLKNIHEVTGILRVLVTATIHDKTMTLFIFGYDPASRLGAPPTIMQGTSAINSGEIIMDRAFVTANDLTLGDTLLIQGHQFRLSGISEGTNAIVAQFAFTTLDDAQELLGFPDIISFFLLTTHENENLNSTKVYLEQQFPMVSVYSKQQFIRNNIQEMATGVLPILGTIAFFGIIIGVAVITLMLYSTILEKREDYAVLKAIGAGQKFLMKLIFSQSILVAVVGFVSGLVLNFVAAALIIKLVPEITLLFTYKGAAIVFVLSLCIGALGSWAPIHKLARIYPAEVFRA